MEKRIGVETALVLLTGTKVIVLASAAICLRVGRHFGRALGQWRQPRSALGCLWLASMLLAVPRAVAQTAPPGHRVASLEIKILSTMLADEGFGEWGFAALVEVDGRRILFDTGANNDTVQRNLKALKLDLSDVEVVILSHNHSDHTTGLLPLRRQYVAKSPRALSKCAPVGGLMMSNTAVSSSPCTITEMLMGCPLSQLLRLFAP